MYDDDADASCRWGVNQATAVGRTERATADGKRGRPCCRTVEQDSGVSMRSRSGLSPAASVCPRSLFSTCAAHTPALL